MGVEVIVAITIILLLVFLALGVPVAFSLATSATLGILLLRSPDQATAALASAPYAAVSSYSLAIIPMYMLLGMLAINGKLSERVYQLAARAFRRIPGGLGVATVAACAGFASVSGSSVATAASVGRMSIAEMRKHGYNPGFAAGIVAVGGTLGVMIPPSVILVMYGILSQESIASLLAAGVVPGLVLALAYMAFVVLRAPSQVTAVDSSTDLERELVHAGARVASVHGAGSAGAPPASSVPSSPSAGAGVGKDSSGIGIRHLRAVLWLGLIFAAVMVGMFSGVFTVIESAAFACLVAVIMVFSENFRSGFKETLSIFADAVKEAAGITSMAFMLLVGASILTTFLVLSRLPQKLVDWVSVLGVPPIVVVIAILIALIPLGMFLESLSLIVVVVPLVHPIITELGYDGIWFAVLFVIMLEIGMITPPVGMNVFVVAGAAKLDSVTVFRGVLPFLIPTFVVIALIILIPEIALWLPGLASGDAP